MPIADRLAALRQRLASRGCDALVIPRADEHLGEYIPAHNERLSWATGFTGSAGMAVILREQAAMFVDGRYTVQVRQQVPAADFSYHHLIKEPPLQWLVGQLQRGDRVAVDPRLHSLEWLRRAEAELLAAGLVLVPDTDNLVDSCWDDRPAAQVQPALMLDEVHTGESSRSKRSRIGQAVQAMGADGALIFAPDSVSWLLNLRGRDVPCLPVLQSLALMWNDGAMDLVVEPARMPAGWPAHCGAGVRVHAPAEAESLLLGQAGKRILADPVSANAWSQQLLERGGATLVAGTDPVVMSKACKNAVEIAGARAAHVRDAVAVVRFLAWLDGEQAAGNLHDEAELADCLLAFRSGAAYFQGPSFETISAAGSNAAMCHYNHRNGVPARLPPDSVYLVDSGAHYTDGTTDITRTVAIGDPGAEVRRLFTLVLKGHIALDQARFPNGTTGTHLDAMARQYLWREGHDYDHGTGHGVGAFLSVHEGPQRVAKAWSAAPLKPGMIISNEPGYYRDDAFGIRCENLMVVTTVDGDLETPMYGFESLTLVPFDQRLLDRSLLDAGEVQWLDAYHDRVMTTIGPELPAAERAWLKQACAPLTQSR